MALSSTMFRFEIELSDIDLAIYETLDLRLAMHPSESIPYLLSRVIAYCLNYQEGLCVTQGIGNPDEPALWIKDLTGVILVWIEVGSPSARRLNKASKAAKMVRVYTYRDPEILLREVAGQEIYRREKIEVFSLDPKGLDKLGESLERDNHWTLLRDDGEISITSRGENYHTELKSLNLKA